MISSKWKSFAGLIAFLAICCAPLAAQSKTMSPQEQSNLKLVLDWWREVVYSVHLDLAPKYMADDYIEHDPTVGTSRAAFVEHFRSSSPRPIPAALPIQPAKAFARGDYVVLMFEHEGKDPADPSQTYKYDSFHVLRIQDGKIQEHWGSARKTVPEAARQ